MVNKIILAAQFARGCHSGQLRKYTGRPYITHPARVAARVSIHNVATTDLVCAAWLHDTIEDCDVTASDLETRFGETVANLVIDMTNTSKASGENRAKRKQMDRDRIAAVCRDAKILKLVDRIDNLMEIDRDSDFAKTYAQESILLAGVLEDADTELFDELNSVAYSILG